MEKLARSRQDIQFAVPMLCFSVPLQAAEAAGSAQGAGHVAHGAGQEAAGNSTGSCCCTASCLAGPPAAHQVRTAHIPDSKLSPQRAFARDWIGRSVLDSRFCLRIRCEVVA
jgi:hypothetical protein